MHILLEKVKEVLFAVLPITIIVLVLHFTLTPFPTNLLIRFLIGAFLIVIGLSIFLFGVDIGITPLGQHIGHAFSKSNNIWFVVVVGLIVGFFMSIAEPSMQILASQVSGVTGGLISGSVLLIVVSVGIAVMLVAGIIRIIYNLPLNWTIFICYGVICVLSFFVSPEFLAISFDASGATTGALAVPFMLALAVGISAMKKDTHASEQDSFGLIGVTSTGAILAVLIMGIIQKVSGLTGSISQEALDDTRILQPFLEEFPQMIKESMVAILPLVVVYLAFQVKIFKFKKSQFRKILKGFAYTLVGLVLFLVGVNAGFMDVGTYLGSAATGLSNQAIVVIIAFVIGMVTILAEPAVHVLTDQIEEVTSGSIKGKVVLAALALGVGLAIALSVLRILVPGIQLWHYLVVGYVISIGLSFVVSPLFVGIGFDSGGVASGPMTATFVLAFVQGVADAAPDANVLTDAFGMIALVAMTPIITLQILGLIVKLKARRRVVSEA